MESLDLVVVGAGWSGLCAANTYLKLNPSSKIAILESASSVGGVWATQRLYPGLKSNNMIGTYEYPEFPMDPSYGVKHGQHMPGKVMHQYLEDYAQKNGILKFVIFNYTVDTAERKSDDSWLLSITVNDGSGNTKKVQILTKRLIVATGVYSEPFVPTIDGQESFDGTIMHSKDFAQHANTLKSLESIVIYGGTKSAWDAAYAYAAAGVQVHMVIRESGHGPVWMAPPYVTPFKAWLEKLVTTRFLTWLSPRIWAEADGYAGTRHFLHGTWLGRKLVDAFWWILGNDVITLNGYDKHPETAKLKPWFPALWTGSSLGILNYETNFFDFVRNGKIKVHISGIAKLSSQTAHLSDGNQIQTSTLLCATGWKPGPSIKFLPAGTEASLGLPHNSTEPNKLAQKADTESLAAFPRLRDQPKRNPKAHTADPSLGDPMAPPPDEPYRLYRFMAPPADLSSSPSSRTIAFSGVLSTTVTAIASQAQALWIAAYFADELTFEEPDPTWSATLHSQFGKWRYPAGHGARFPDFVFDGIPYIDLLLRDLGLPVHRKGGGVKEIFTPYGVDDYRGLVEEWKLKQKKDL